ncbi:methyltransferase [Paraglaciecola sp. L3A3]|uniref:methyltransferase n=1 Tax=Paraglaciecola sp. L3A3 TaxID=2686358 RepID=UPI00131ECEDE|nr:methyltransferase [Paraglaciecola sp. L3A3]
MNTSLTLLNRNLQLHRYPQNLQHPSWQAWDAADEYIIEHVEQHIENINQCSIHIYNDDFGTLACWFADAKPSWISDSYVSLQACKQNLAANNLSIQDHHFYDSVTEVKKNADVILIKIPKTIALLEQQLIDMQKFVTANTQVIAGGKANLIQKSTQALFDKYLGPCKTSLAKKKSRLIFCQPMGDKSDNSPYPTVWHTENPRFEISNLANVFARQQLDIGARFMLQHFSKLPSFDNKNIVDLGCGNGVLGLHILEKSQSAKVIFTDESYMAIASSKLNVENNHPQLLDNCKFIVNNCLDDFAEKSTVKTIDLVLCNPPFHQQNTITDHIAWQMFKDSKDLLTKGGQIFVIGNRHLDYPAKLKRLFSKVTIVATDRKFSILSATK